MSNNLIEKIKAEDLHKPALEGRKVSSVAEEDKVGSFPLVISHSNFCFLAVTQVHDFRAFCQLHIITCNLHNVKLQEHMK